MNSTLCQSIQECNLIEYTWKKKIDSPEFGVSKSSGCHKLSFATTEEQTCSLLYLWNSTIAFHVANV